MSFVGRVANDLAIERLIAAVTRLESKVDDLSKENAGLRDQIENLTHKLDEVVPGDIFMKDKVKKPETKPDPMPMKMVRVRRTKSVPSAIKIEDILGEALILHAEQNQEKRAIALQRDRSKAAEARARLTEHDRIKVDRTFLRSARTGKLEDVKWMMELGADLDVKDSANWTALIHAAANGYLNIVQVLLAKGATVDAADDLKMTALMFAAYRGYALVVHALVSAGANVNIQDSWGRTALQFAKDYSGPDVIRTLMDAGGVISTSTI